MKTNATKRRKWLIGKWVLADQTSSVEYEVVEKAGKIRVRAYDLEDEEFLIVSGVRWAGDALEFSTWVRSNDFRATHRIVAISKKKVRQEISSVYYWKPTEPRFLQKYQATRKARATPSKE